MPTTPEPAQSDPQLSEPSRADYLTLAFAYFAVGVTVSVALLDAGTSVTRTLVSALVIYAATPQLAFLAVQAAGGSTVVGVLSGWLVASRFGILASSLGARYPDGRLERTAAAINSFDPNVALAMQHERPADVRRIFWLVTAALMVGWWIGTGVGIVLGNVLGDSEALGLDAVFPAILLAIIGSSLRRRDGLTAAVAGACICIVLIPVTPGGVPILASALGAVLALAFGASAATGESKEATS